MLEADFACLRGQGELFNVSPSSSHNSPSGWPRLSCGCWFELPLKATWEETSPSRSSSASRSLYDYNPNLATYMKVRVMWAHQECRAGGSWEGA